MTDELDNKVTRNQLAKILDVTPEHISRLTKEGLPRTGHGRGTKYPLREAIEWWTQQKVEIALKRNQTPTNVTEEEAKVRKLLADAKLRELELYRIEGSMVLIEDSEREIATQLERVRSKLLAIPAVLGPQIIGLKNIPDAVELLQEFVHRMMEDLSTVNDEDYDTEDDSESEEESEEDFE